jgi:TonB family protein
MSAPYLITVIVKSSLLLAVGLISLRLLRKADAGLRHSICVFTLATATASVLLAFWNPGWSLPVPVFTVAASNGINTAKMPIPWPAVILAVWALGAVVMLSRWIGGLFAVALARRRSTPFQIHHGLDVRIGRVAVPLTCGVFRPLVLLPESAGGWDEMRLRAVVLHERAHVRRRDCLAKHLAQWSRALLWWHPLAWIVAARLDREQELACDAAVLASGIPADDYANVLLDAARECSSGLLLGCAMNGAQALRARLANLFNHPTRSSKRLRFVTPAILLVLTLAAPSFAEKIYKIGPGIVPPKLLMRTEPQYTDEARDAKIEGRVVLSIVVGTDQRAHDVKVIQSLDTGLDANAVASIKTWQFQPGTKDGKPVPVRAIVEVNFRLQ